MLDIMMTCYAKKGKTMNVSRKSTRHIRRKNMAAIALSDPLFHKRIVADKRRKKLDNKQYKRKMILEGRDA